MASDDTRFKELLHAASEILSRASDDSVGELLSDGVLDEFIRAIAEPKKPGRQTIYDYLRDHRTRLQIIASLRNAVTHNYSIRAHVDGTEVFVSPHFNQWVEDGVIFLQGRERFAGLIGLYRNGEIRFAVAARDKAKGDESSPNDFLFVSPDEARSAVGTPSPATDPASAIGSLEALLARREKAESAYQSFFESNPWMFGAQHKAIQPHRRLDDENLPDFTGVRVRDGARDIIEIKQPFLQLFTKGGGFSKAFQDAWDQCERYLDLAISQRQYLLEQKGLRFENPHAYLILGHNLDREQRGHVARKQRAHPRITILTYDAVVAMARNVVALLQQLKSGDGTARENPAGDDAEGREP